MVLLSLPLSKSGLNYLSRWFISLKFEDKKYPGLKPVSGLNKPDNSVIGGRKGSETWFKIENRKDKGGNAYMVAKILAKLQKNTFSDKFLYKSKKARFVLKSGLISVQSGLV